MRTLKGLPRPLLIRILEHLPIMDPLPFVAEGEKGLTLLSMRLVCRRYRQEAVRCCTRWDCQASDEGLRTVARFLPFTEDLCLWPDHLAVTRGREVIQDSLGHDPLGHTGVDHYRHWVLPGKLLTDQGLKGAAGLIGLRSICVAECGEVP